MIFRLISLIMPALLGAAVEAGSIEGRVTSSTDHTPVARAIVTIGTQTGGTDPAGNFRVEGVLPGAHSVSVEAPGFLKRDRISFRLDSAITPGHLDLELVPTSSISGRVLDDQGNPLTGASVEITEAVRGTGTTWSIWGSATDQEGRYHVENLRPGAYLVMARPKTREIGPDRRVWVPTFYPSAPTREMASRQVLTGGSHQAGCDIRLLAVPVYAIGGMIYDDSGKPANATVSLLRPDAFEKPEAEVKAHDGVFRFPDVPSGDWRLIAETERAGVKLRGIGSVLLSRQDIETVNLRMTGPLTVRGFVKPPGQTESITVELYPTDAPPRGAAFAKATADGKLQFQSVYPGHYRINVFATIPAYYLGAVLMDDQDMLGKDVLFAEGAPPIYVIFQPNSTSVRGKVEECGSGAVLILPQDEGLWDFRFIRHTTCDSTGRFDIGGLRPGNYYALALDRIDSTGLDDLVVLRCLAGMAEKLAVEPGRAVYVELKRLKWPDIR